MVRNQIPDSGASAATENGNAVAMLQNLRVSTNGGISVPLSTVVSLATWAPNATWTVMTVKAQGGAEANLAGIPLGCAGKINALPSMQQLPAGALPCRIPVTQK